ncbi:MAG TPA: MFS transporter [Blastocatellia bacterium]|nr:MFS transporter [Blastocatellia bacterium]
MNPWRALGRLPRELWILFIATLVNRAGTMALVFLTLYVTRSLGLTDSQAGLVFTVYGIGAIITAPLAGRLSDRAGPLRVMKLSLFFSGAILFVLPFAQTFFTILVITFLWAVAGEALRPASMAIISDVATAEQRKPAFALNRLAINLGMSVGPVVGGFLAEFSFKAIFFVDGATSIAAGLILVAWRWRFVRADAADAPAIVDAVETPVKRLGVLRDRHFLYFLLALIPVEIVFFQSHAAMPLFLVRDLGLSPSVYGALFAVNTVIIVLLEVPLNSAMANWPHRPALALGSFLFGAGFGGLAFVTGFWSAAATVVVWTFAEMILFPGSSAYVADLAPAKKRGEYMGLYTMGFSVAFAIGPGIGALVYDKFGGLTLWTASFVTGCISALMMARLRSKPSATHQAQR